MLLDALHARDVSRLVLRHGAAPAVHAGEDRAGVQLQNIPEFAMHRLQDLVIAETEHGFIARAPQEATQDAFVLGRAMRKLIVDESAGQHACAFAARHQETEARRQTRQLLLVVTQGDGDGRAVRDVQKVPGKAAVHAVQQSPGNIGGSSDEHGIKAFLAIHLDRHAPGGILGIDPEDVRAQADGFGIQAGGDGLHHLLHTILQGSKQRSGRMFARGHHFLVRRQHGPAETAVLLFHLDETRQHRARAEFCGISAINARK